MPQQLTNEAGADERVGMPAAISPPVLDAVLQEVREQGARARRTQQGFAIFAVLALVIALVELVVIAAKLDNGTTRTRAAAAPAAAAATKKAAGPTAAAALPHKVSVKLAEFSVKPSAQTAAAGKVTFNVHNGGTITHEFVVVRTSKAAGSLLKGARADESGNVGETGDLRAGQSKQLALKLPPGHYALICNLPGHYAAGQHVDFTVK